MKKPFSENLLAATPGLKVVTPATAYDAKGLMKTAIRDNDPVMFCNYSYAGGYWIARSRTGNRSKGNRRALPNHRRPRSGDEKLRRALEHWLLAFCARFLGRKEEAYQRLLRLTELPEIASGGKVSRLTLAHLWPKAFTSLWRLGEMLQQGVRRRWKQIHDSLRAFRSYRY
jgi:hypothetical protein